MARILPGAGWLVCATLIGCSTGGTGSTIDHSAVGAGSTISRSAGGAGTAGDPRYTGLEVQFHGHRDIQRARAGEWEPLVTEREARIGVCVTAAPLIDTSRWQARWTIDEGARTQYVSPAKRLETTLGFEQPLPATLGPGEHRLCPELRDDFDGVSKRLDCVPFCITPEPEKFRTIGEALDGAYAAMSSLGHDAYLDRLEALSQDATKAGFPILATRARLMAVHDMRGRGTIDDWKRVDRLLNEKPAFLGAPAALRMAGEYDLASANARSDRNIELRTAWQELSAASIELQRSLSDSWPVPRLRQADLIASAGSPGEARMRLAELSEECRTYGCEPRMLNAVLGTHAWHTLLDLDSSESDLAQARTELTDAIGHSQPKEDALVLANRWVNLAFVELRAEKDARPALDRARRLLAGEDTAGTGRAGLYAAWARILGGLDALRRGAPQEALAACRPPDHASVWPQLAAQALGCRARARRRLGDRPRARREIDRALAIHAEISGASIGQVLSLGPGQRAEDFYFAAGLAIEDGDPASAWRTLEDLDTLSGLEADRARCAGGSEVDREREQKRLAAELESLSGPAPLDRISQREGVARSLRGRLEELIRLRGVCGEAAQMGTGSSGAPSSDPDARVFALEDAVVSLWRLPEEGAIRVQRVALTRAERIRRLDALESAARRPISAEDWDELAEPFARALIPAGRNPAVPVRIALYGSMQRVPLTALPVNASPIPAPPFPAGRTPAGVGSAISRWGEMTAIVVVPSGAAGVTQAGAREGPGEREEHSRPGEGAPLFIVDPTRNLAAGDRLARLYRTLFPQGTILQGAGATRAGVEEALRQSAGWIHFDGHGRVDPAFGELSSIRLADADLLADDLARGAGARELVNLSGCQTGRSAVTADSGQFGAARVLLGHGARWVVVSRTDLPDEIALVFDTAFYESLRSGAGTPEAFRGAVAVMARSWPPARWAGLMLLGHP